MSNIIHSVDCCGGKQAIFLDATDRGPRGEQGEQGERGEIGIGVSSVMSDPTSGHLIVEYTDGTTHDAGELPKIVAQVAFNTILDGRATEIALPESIDPASVSCLLINGIVYTAGWTIEDGILTIQLEDGTVPSGKLELIVNAQGISADGGGRVISVEGKTGVVLLDTISESEIYDVMDNGSILTGE